MADCEVEIFHITNEGAMKLSPAEYESRLLNGLKDVYTQSNKKRAFPEDACFWTSNRLKDLGLISDFGWFQLDFPIIKERGLLESHNWSLDSLNRIVDLTLTQMNIGLEQKVPSGIIIIDPNTRLYQRFIRRNCSSRWINEI